MFFEDENKKSRKRDRILVLKPIEGKHTVSSTGNVDNRLFTNENKLHAIRSPINSLWTLRYEIGVLPQVLKQKFTTFDELLSFCKSYFKRRNIEITEVID